MIPILYDYAEKRFTTNGIGRLSDCISCTVTEERNGIYECEFKYPITGEHYSEIKEGMVIGVTHDELGKIQPFEIYAHQAPIDGVVTFNAHHVSYRLSNVVIMPFTASSPSAAFAGIESHSANPNPFLFWTDKGGSGTFKVEKPDYCRAILGGQEGSILDAFGGGEYEFDRFEVKLYASRGSQTQVQIRYGKNLADITDKADTSSTYNAIVPFWLSTDGTLVTLPEEVLVYSGATIYETNLTTHNQVIIRDHLGNPITVTYQQINAVPFDMSSDFQEQPTVSQLRNAAISKFNSSNAWLPQRNIEVDFVQLWQTEEYKNFAPLQRVRLCDTVSVFYDALGVNAVNMKVVKTVWNVLLDRYDSMELGQLSSTLAQTISGPIESQFADTVSRSMMAEAIQHATDLIRGGLGGYVVMKPNANGEPEEILIMDTPDINTAVNVWRFNQGGLGHSHSGYDGPFNDVALTQDGKINANMITTGRLNANYIQGGTLTLGGASNTYGTMSVLNASGNTDGTWNNKGIWIRGNQSVTVGTTQAIRLDVGGIAFGTYNGTTFTPDNSIVSVTGGSVTVNSVGNLQFNSSLTNGSAAINVDLANSGGGASLVLNRTSGYISSSGVQRIWWNSSGVGIYNGASISSAYLPANSSLSSSYHIKVVNGIIMNA